MAAPMATRMAVLEGFSLPFLGASERSFPFGCLKRASFPLRCQAGVGCGLSLLVAFLDMQQRQREWRWSPAWGLPHSTGKYWRLRMVMSPPASSLRAHLETVPTCTPIISARSPARFTHRGCGTAWPRCLRGGCSPPSAAAGRYPGSSAAGGPGCRSSCGLWQRRW